MQGISDIITIPGLVNVDFADVKAIMSNSGTAMLGVGVSSGKNRAEEAALVGAGGAGWGRQAWRRQAGAAGMGRCRCPAAGGWVAFHVPVPPWLRMPRPLPTPRLPRPPPPPPPPQAATSAPLIERSIERATGIVYNITGGKDLTLQEVNRVSEVVTSLADPSANVIFGAVIDDAVREGGGMLCVLCTLGVPAVHAAAPWMCPACAASQALPLMKVQR